MDSKLDRLERAARKGDIEAIHQLGCHYAFGDEANRDYNIAAQYFELSADSGHSESARLLANLYAEGKGVRRDYDKAFTYLGRAAMKRNAMAEYDIGYMFMNGIGVRRDFDEAEKWFRLAKADGDMFAGMAIALISDWRRQLAKKK